MASTRDDNYSYTRVEIVEDDFQVIVPHVVSTASYIAKKLIIFIRGIICGAGIIAPWAGGLTFVEIVV
jgi:hypothetical protein